MKNLLRCRAVRARSKRVDYKGIYSALTALFSHQPGATPQELGYTNDKAFCWSIGPGTVAPGWQ